MNFAQNINVNQRNEFYVGGMVYVLPALCLHPACASAHVPAYVECTGGTVAKKMDDMRTVRPMSIDSLISLSELRL